MKVHCKLGVILLILPVLAFPAFGGCSSESTESPVSLDVIVASPDPALTPDSTAENGLASSGSSPVSIDSSGTVVITIGNLTDLSGPGADAMSYANMALDDMVEYYNEENLIPGVEFKIITYDEQLDPSRDVPGYERLKHDGADLIFTPVPSAAVILKPRLEEDKIVMFALAPTEQALSPPGYVFSPGSVLCKPQSYTLLKWIAENDPDFPEGRPAKVGGAFWAESYGASLLAGAKEYAHAHPDQYDWQGEYLTDFTFNWLVEVEELKHCDYVIPPVPMTQFVRQYREAGYDGKFIGFDAHLGFMGALDIAGLWEEVDGMLLIKPGRWWNEEGEVIDLGKALMRDNHPGKVKDIMESGCGYLAIYDVYVIFELISDAMETTGPANFSPQAIYDAAQSFSIDIEGCEHSFNEIRRASSNCLGIYEFRGDEKDIFRIDPEWIPAITTP